MSDKPFPPYADIANLPEDDRIELIGRQVQKMGAGKIVAFLTDDEVGKPERYIEKLRKRFPGLVVVDKRKGPIENVVTVRIRLAPQG